MLTIVRMLALPEDFKYSTYALSELEEARWKVQDVVKGSQKAWLVLEGRRPLLALGVSKTTLVGNHGRLWALLSPDLRLRHLRELKRAFRLLLEEYPVLTAYVRCDFCKGTKFAEFFGFKTLYTYGDFRLYEVRR